MNKGKHISIRIDNETHYKLSICQNMKGVLLMVKLSIY